ncbi:unknown [Prevotella sp. CAG:1092]|nr:unknown [Prevotella sp. CAG:1092]
MTSRPLPKSLLRCQVCISLMVTIVRLLLLWWVQRRLRIILSIVATRNTIISWLFASRLHSSPSSTTTAWLKTLTAWIAKSSCKNSHATSSLKTRAKKSTNLSACMSSQCILMVIGSRSQLRKEHTTIPTQSEYLMSTSRVDSSSATCSASATSEVAIVLTS